MARVQTLAQAPSPPSGLVPTVSSREPIKLSFQWGRRPADPPVLSGIVLGMMLSLIWVAFADAETRDGPKGAAPARLSTAQLARLIDDHFEESWKAEKVTPAPLADDGEFLRRASLDLIGRIPQVSLARSYLADRDPEKAEKLVRHLIGRAGFASHLATTFREWMLPGAYTNPQFRPLVPSFEAWLRIRFSEHTPYDRLVHELLTVVIPADADRLVTRQASPLSFYLVNERKPENLAASVSRTLLGVQVQCAQCHDHPMAEWKQEQFWGLAAFFVQEAEGPRALLQRIGGRRGIEIPDKKKWIEPTYLDGTRPKGAQSLGRQQLAEWVLAPDNPYFARAVVNRLWNLFLGHGLVEPVDDLGSQSVANHPRVFDALSEQFVLHGYDLAYLCEAITMTKVYRRSSVPTHPSQEEPSHFARMPVRGMTPEQLWDSLVQATGMEPRSAQGTMANANPFDLGSPKARFVTRFSEPSRPTELQTSMLQALSLMNGAMIGAATNPQTGVTLQAILEAPFFDDAGKLEAMFLAAYARMPNEVESRELLARVNAAGSGEQKNAVFAAIYWALLNSAEFCVIP